MRLSSRSAIAGFVMLFVGIAAAGDEVVFRGIVVDDQEQPVAGINVRPLRWDEGQSLVVTDSHGEFELSVARTVAKHLLIIAASQDGSSQGYAQYNPTGADPQDLREPLRIVLKPARVVTVLVRDADGKPLAQADVEVGVDSRAAGGGPTASDGQLAVSIPADAPLQYVIALKPGAGFDYLQRPAAQDGSDFEFPDPVELTLDGASTIRIEAVDTNGQPVAGVEFAPWYIQKPGRENDVYTSGSRLVREVTDEQGVAVFDWLPAEFERSIPILFRSRNWHCSDQFNYRSDALETTFRAKLLRLGRVTGRVRRADGSPAPGIVVQLDGEGPGIRDTFRTSVVTDDEGRYVADVAPRHGYIIAVVDDAWAAKSLMDFPIDEAEQRDGLDLTLVPGARLHGILTDNNGEKLAGKSIGLLQRGNQIPFDAGDGSNIVRAPSHMRWVQTNDKGEYEFRVGPGDFTLMGPDGRFQKEVTVADQSEYEADLQFEDPNKAMTSLTGRVTQADNGRPVPEVVVSGVPIDPNHFADVSARTDNEGRFQVQRRPSRMFMHALTKDGSLGATTEIDSETRELELRVSPTATATGQVVDEHGRPTPGFRFRYAIEVKYPDGSMTARFGDNVVTDDDGRFRIGGLIVGQEYELRHRMRNSFYLVSKVLPDSARPIELGTLKYPREQRRRTFVEWMRDAYANSDPASALATAVDEGRWDRRRTLAIVSRPGAPPLRALFELFDQMQIDTNDPWQQRVQRNFVDDFVLAGIAPSELAVLRSRGGEELPDSEESFPLLVALDEDGRALGHLAAEQFRSAGPGAAITGRAVVSFLKQHAPDPVDAGSLFDAAIKQAAAEGKAILFIQVSSHDEPSERLARTLARHRQLLEPHFVQLTIDARRMLHGGELIQAVREQIGGQFRRPDDNAVPWVGIVTAELEPLRTSAGEAGVARPLSSTERIETLLGLLREASGIEDTARLQPLRESLLRAATYSTEK